MNCKILQTLYQEALPNPTEIKMVEMIMVQVKTHHIITVIMMRKVRIV